MAVQHPPNYCLPWPRVVMALTGTASFTKLVRWVVVGGWRVFLRGAPVTQRHGKPVGHFPSLTS